ncbi:hypothetical protein [Streptomyces sp. NPDC048611]|uniref:hypothetical protein n=1 Tax=Streptomyces sp. NPDC048611 TaxID=3155635 RepID=UPI00343FD1A5
MTTRRPHPTEVSEENLRHPRTRQAFRNTKLLVGCYAVLPGTFPLWLKIEQGVCGALLTGVTAIGNGRQLRSAFAPTAARDELTPSSLQ